MPLQACIKVAKLCYLAQKAKSTTYVAGSEFKS